MHLGIIRFIMNSNVMRIIDVSRKQPFQTEPLPKKRTDHLIPITKEGTTKINYIYTSCTYIVSIVYGLLFLSSSFATFLFSSIFLELPLFIIFLVILFFLVDTILSRCSSDLNIFDIITLSIFGLWCL